MLEAKSIQPVQEEIKGEYAKEGIRIVEGSTYIYTADIPKGCAGQLYKVHRFIVDVPSYQRKVLVEALSGRDKGLWFTCSISNFSVRYKEPT